jgi:hypothetical protein
MARSTRILYRGMQGRVRLNRNWAPLNRNSAVVITAKEIASGKLSFRELLWIHSHVERYLIS